MIVLAVLCLALVAAMVIFMVFGGFDSTATIDWDLVNLAWQTNALAVFLAGALTLLVAEFALVLLGRGTRRKVEQRRELKRLRKVEQESTAGSRQGQPQTTPGHQTTAPAPVPARPAQSTATQATPTQTTPTQTANPPQTTSTQASSPEASPPQGAPNRGATTAGASGTDQQVTSGEDPHGNRRP